MPDAKNERRSRSRVVTRVSVQVRPPKGAVATVGHTRDLTASGVFFYTDSEICEGSELEIVLMMPPELTGGEKRWVCCQAAVVRVEDGEGQNGFGVAASIRNMQLLPEILP